MVESNKTSKNYEIKNPLSRFRVYIDLKMINLKIRRYFINEL